MAPGAPKAAFATRAAAEAWCCAHAACNGITKGHDGFTARAGSKACASKTADEVSFLKPGVKPVDCGYASSPCRGGPPPAGGAVATKAWASLLGEASRLGQVKQSRTGT